VRELHLGIETWDSCLAPLTFASHSYPEFHLLMPLFACRKWTGRVSWGSIRHGTPLPARPAQLTLREPRCNWSTGGIDPGR
jgi:hypothetical protein